MVWDGRDMTSSLINWTYGKNEPDTWIEYCNNILFFKVMYRVRSKSDCYNASLNSEIATFNAPLNWIPFTYSKCSTNSNVSQK